MEPATLLRELNRRGVRVWPHGDRLRIQPADLVDPAEMEAIRAFKPRLMQLLATPTGGTHALDVRPFPDGFPASWTAGDRAEWRDERLAIELEGCGRCPRCGSSAPLPGCATCGR